MTDNHWIKNTTVGVATLAVLMIAGCTDETSGVDEGVECTVDEDCDEGYVCDLDDNTCVPVSDDDNGDDDNGDDDNGDDGYDDGDRRDDGPYDDECTFVDRADEFEPDEIWSFEVDESMPYAEYDGHGSNEVFKGHSINQVMMTPAVVDLDDGAGEHPDVIFTTFATDEKGDEGWDWLVTGVLRAIDGSDGSHRWSVGYEELGEMEGIAADEPRVGFMPGGSVATGDIDGDGTVEIVAPIWTYDEDGPLGLAAIDDDGEVLWVTDDDEPRDIGHWWGGPALADLDGNGEPEIIVGSVVYDNEGQFMWDGRDQVEFDELDRDPGTGSNFWPTDGDPADQERIGPLSVVEDIDGSGTREVITGRAAFAHDGTVLWEVDDDEVGGDETLEEGYPGVADFSGDGEAEVVVVSAGTVRIHRGSDGALVWGPVDVPNSGRLGPPTIADLNGDGTPEIGVAGLTSYIALEVDGDQLDVGYTPAYDDVEMWENETRDESSNTTGSSVFDFNGDGEASIVYNDEEYVHVFDGPTGDGIFKAESPSVTALDNPVIVDVNNDGAANIVVPTNDYECGGMLDECDQGAGLIAFGDADDNWVTTRRIWNQHAYSINNVEEDGTIPSDPTPSYLDHNTYRLNKLTEIEPQAAPDLYAEDPDVEIDECSVTVGVWVANGGAIQVGTIPISLYAEDGDDRQLLATTETLDGLAPGESEYVSLTGELPDDGDWDLVVVVDDDDGESTRNECNEDNNRLVVDSETGC